jgi:ClpP class serine protease
VSNREPALLTPKVLAAHRPGRQCFVALGAAAGVPRRRPSGYQRVRAFAPRPRAQVGAGGKASIEPACPAIVHVRGVLTHRPSFWDCGEGDNYESIEARAIDALCDPMVSALVVDADSPGGDGPGLEQTILKIRNVADELGKQILGYVNEFAGSACVWLLSGICDAIYLPPSGMAGSVGCLVPLMIAARALRRDGIDVYIARAPAGKAKPNEIEPLDPVGKARVDRLAAEGEARFVAALSASRGIAPEVIRSWNGDMFTGDAARAAGLADGVALAGLDSVLQLAAELGAQREAA